MLKHEPAWWQLYLFAPIMFGLLAVAQLRPWPGLSAQVFEAAVMALTFGAMFVWVYLNRAQLGADDRRRSSDARPYKITIYEPRLSPPPVESSVYDSSPVALARPATRLRGRQLPVRSGSNQRFPN